MSRTELKRRDTVDYIMREEEDHSIKKHKSTSCKPINGFTTPLLTDMYQISMAYAYWNAGKHNQTAVFDLYFRQTPFEGEFATFAGLEECIRFLSDYSFKDDQIDFLRSIMPDCKEEFWSWLKTVSCSEVAVYALPEGSLCFPRIPLLRVEGPVAICQLLESTLLNLVNYPTLICTYAARLRLAAGPNKKLLEFGMRRAQGPDGAISASRYAIMGGFDGTSNVLAARLFGLVPKGTHAHAFVSSFSSDENLKNQSLRVKGTETEKNFLEEVMKVRQELGYVHTNTGELLAFVSYAISYPSNFLALADTYDTLFSGVPNFLCVALALHRFGYTAVGIRLDSGDLAYLSKEARSIFKSLAVKYNVPHFANFSICASNDICERTLLSLNQQGHEIDIFGIGTHLVTCKSQPALGGVYKLVQIDNQPRIKISEDVLKVTLPGRKETYRLFNKEGQPIFDLTCLADGKEKPEVGKRILCRHPYEETKRAFVTPTKVVCLHECVWDHGVIVKPFPYLTEVKTYVMEQLQCMRPDHLRPLNPTPYKVSVTSELYEFFHNLWLKEAPIREYNDQK